MRFINWMLIALLCAAVFLVGCGSKEKDLNVFAACLTEKGVKMYGASWCPHCQQQKDMFGTAFSHVDYIECGNGNAECTAAGIKNLPTWKFADGTSVVGTQQLNTLAKKSGCEI